MRIRTLLAATGAALLLGGCSGTTAIGEPTDSATSAFKNRTGAEVAAAAADAVAAAGSVHVTGAMTQSGTRQAVDLHLQGDDVAGTIATGGQDLEILVTGGATYARADADFWADNGMPAEIVPDFHGAWVLMPGEAAAEFGALTLEVLVEQLRDTEGLQDEVRREERDGVAVLVLSYVDGSTLTVEASRPRYPLVLESRGGRTGALEYSRFGEREDFTAPVDYIDLAEYAA